MTRAEAARGTLAMNEQLPTLSVDDVWLNLAGIVGYIVEQGEFSIWNDFAESAANQMRNDLPVCESTIRGGTHCAKIVLAQFRTDRGAGKFTIWNGPITLDHHGFQIVRSHLVT